jgi:hypothetical protein
VPPEEREEGLQEGAVQAPNGRDPVFAPQWRALSGGRLHLPWRHDRMQWRLQRSQDEQTQLWHVRHRLSGESGLPERSMCLRGRAEIVRQRLLFSVRFPLQLRESDHCECCFLGLSLGCTIVGGNPTPSPLCCSLLCLPAGGGPTGICAPGANGTPCNVDEHCASDNCNEDNLCAP